MSTARPFVPRLSRYEQLRLLQAPEPNRLHAEEGQDKLAYDIELQDSQTIQARSSCNSQCVNHSLRMHHHVPGVCCVDMLACLGLHLMDECFELVDRHRILPSTRRRLCSSELDQETVRHTLVVDVSSFGNMRSACC